MKNASRLSANNKVWRYMSFSRFVWTIQNQCLWLSRANLLGDPWEISLSGEQLQLVIDRHPISPIDEPPQPETATERAERIINLWRNKSFINCWNMSVHESNALWQIYCKNTDGVVLQTTIEKLELIKGQYSLYPVTYPTPGSNKKTPTHTDLITKKRPMFKYEEEIRIVHFDKNNEIDKTIGLKLEFNFEELIDSVRIHPQADSVFFEIVQSIVKKYAPDFQGKVTWSDMKLDPPF